MIPERVICMLSDKTGPESAGASPSAALSDEQKLAKAESKRRKKEKQKRRREKQKMKGKQGKRNTPRPVRLQKAKAWIAEYEGSDIIRAYRKHFAVSPECAFAELKLLGVAMTEEYISKFLQSQENKAIQERNKKLKRRARLRAKRRGENTARDAFPDSDDRFFFIAGYTSGGAPYGVTWEEMNMEPYGSLPEEGSDESGDE